MVSSHDIFRYKEVISECEGCKRIHKTIYGKRICSCHCFPHTMWWFGDVCPQASHKEDRKPCEDPIKEP